MSGARPLTQGFFSETKEEMSSGQIIATSHDLTPNGGLVREIPLFQGNLGWWNIIPFGQMSSEVVLMEKNPHDDIKGWKPWANYPGET